jgi:hypothetical protein
MIPGIGVGRIVHFVVNGKCYAAMIVDDQGGGGTSGICVLKVSPRPSSVLAGHPLAVVAAADYHVVAQYNADGDIDGYWHFPERV